MIITNERKYAERLLESKTIGENVYSTISLLARYYRHVLHSGKQQSVKAVTEFLNFAYPKYSNEKAVIDEHIEKSVNRARYYPLVECDGVWITKNEMKRIQSIHGKPLQRLAFTLLCLAKFGNTKNGNNNGWVNVDAKEIFTLARIPCTAIERYERMYELGRIGLIEFAKRNDNLNCRVTFISDDQRILFVSDFRELGYEYLRFCGEHITPCQECGTLIRNNKFGNKKYCAKCAGYHPKPFKTVVCIDCGTEFEVRGNNKRTQRCEACTIRHRQQYDRDRKYAKQLSTF